MCRVVEFLGLCVFYFFVCDFVLSKKWNQFSSWFNWLGDELGLSLSTLSPKIFTATLARLTVEVALPSSVVSRYSWNSGFLLFDFQYFRSISTRVEEQNVSSKLQSSCKVNCQKSALIFSMQYWCQSESIWQNCKLAFIWGGQKLHWVVKISPILNS